MKSKLNIFLTVIAAVLLFNSLNMLNSYWVASSLAQPQGVPAEQLAVINSQLSSTLTVSLIELVAGLILLILACFVVSEKD